MQGLAEPAEAAIHGPAARRARLPCQPPPSYARRPACAAGAPRLTGAVLRSAADPTLPWHRVVRADGSLAKGERQRALLEGEGAPFDARGRVALRVARLPPDHVDPG